jgi:hypothetical protein
MHLRPTPFVLLLLLHAPLKADMIGLNFTYTTTGTTRTPDVLFSSTEEAGAPGYRQSHWNHFSTDWSGTVENDPIFAAGVVDRHGVPVSGAGLLSIPYGVHSDPVHFDSQNIWASNLGNATADFTLMNGYLDDGTDNQPYINIQLAPGFYATYSVVIYINGDTPSQGSGRYWLESWTDPLLEGTVLTDRIGVANLNGGPGMFNGTYVQAGGADFGPSASPVNLDVSAGHYLVFTGITARNLRIRAAGNADPEDFGRAPIHAVQIVNAVPEPGSSTLLVGGLLALSRLGRRR